MTDHDYGFRPISFKELEGFIAEKLAGEQDYNSCVNNTIEAMLATFNLFSREFGMTGFQASCAAISIPGRINGIDGPYGLVKAEDMLYPQMDPVERVSEWRDGWRGWLKEKAIELMAEREKNHVPSPNDGLFDGFKFGVHPNVWAHWEMLAAYEEKVDA